MLNKTFFVTFSLSGTKIVFFSNCKTDYSNKKKNYLGRTSVLKVMREKIFKNLQLNYIVYIF